MLASWPMAPLFAEVAGAVKELLKSLIVELRNIASQNVCNSGHLRVRRREGKSTDVRARVDIDIQCTHGRVHHTEPRIRRGIWNLLFNSLLKKLSDSGGGRSSIERGGTVDDAELDNEGEVEWSSVGS